MATTTADTPDFVFFETVAELAMWEPGTADPLHISNTPLLSRTTTTITTNPATTGGGKPYSDVKTGTGNLADPSDDPPLVGASTQLLVCHDFKGGYMNYEASQGVVGSEIVYTCEYLQFVDVFVYFSHKRVAVPPAAWINFMHRNGVRVLGTFIVEGNDGTSELRNIFQPDPNKHDASHYASQLAKLAQVYGFDGWLLNLESRFPSEIFDLSILISWIDYLRDELHRLVPGSQLIWYDALTIDNHVWHQNGLTDANKPLFDVSDGIFTNYWWDARQLENTAMTAAALGRQKDVLTGVDVWGRGTLGGGGFNVGEALSQIQRHGLAAALFAPGWTHERLGAKDFWENERKFWVGDRNTQHSEKFGPIKQYVKLFGSGSSNFFFTNFCRGFGKGWRMRGEPISSNPWIHLGAQSVLPTFSSGDSERLRWDLSSEYAYSGAWSLGISGQTAGEISHPHGDISICPLYKLDLSITEHTSVELKYLSRDKNRVSKAGIYIDIMSPIRAPKLLRKYLPFEDALEEKWLHMRITSFAEKMQVRANFAGSKIVEFGVYFKHGPTEDPAGGPIEKLKSVDHTDKVGTQNATFLYLGEISISSLAPQQPSPYYKINSLLTTVTANGRTRLSWKITPGVDDRPEHLRGPYSGTTGPFSYFVIYSGGVMQGLAFATEFTLSGILIGHDEEYSVDGVMWDGSIISSSC